MHPTLTTKNFADCRSAHADPVSYCLLRAAIAAKVEDTLDIGGVELGVTVSLTTIRCSVFYPVLKIACMCIPSKIVEAAIRLISIGKVARFHFVRARAAEGFQHETMDSATCMGCSAI
jgi:hypothetical protein